MPATSYERAIAALLIADEDVNSIVKRRVRVHVTQGDPLPYVVLQTIDNRRTTTYSGALGHCRARLQVEAWADSYDAAKALATAIRRCLSGYAGIIDGVTIHACILDDEADIAVLGQEGAGVGPFGVRADYLVVHQEPT